MTLQPRWRYTLGALLAIALAVPIVLSTLVLVTEIHDRGPRGQFAVVELFWVGLALAEAAAILVALFASRGKLHRHSQVLLASASTSRDWLWECDLDDRITYSNHAVTDLLGYQPAELIGVCHFDLLADDPARHAAHKERDRTWRLASGWDNIELEWRHRDGSTVAMQGSAAPIRDRAGHIVGFRGTRRLLSEQRHPRAIVVAARQAIADLVTSEAFDMALQPIVDLTSGRLTGVEALARFRDGRGPDAWFGDARIAGRVPDLEQLTFDKAVPLLRDLPEPVYLSVNIGPGLLMDMTFRERLTSSGLPLDRLVIEITEHDRVADYGLLNAALEPLRASGIRFAIDDTGAGYASLSHVLQLDPDIIKLDRALIADLDHDRARRSLITALVLLALDVGATVTGEGVETGSQLDTLATLGVDNAQGYFLARPTTDSNDWPNWWQRQWAIGCPLPVASATSNTDSGGPRLLTEPDRPQRPVPVGGVAASPASAHGPSGPRFPRGSAQAS